MLGYYTVEQVTQVMDVILEKNMQVMVNHEPADMATKVYDNFTVEWTLADEKRKESDAQTAGSSEPETGNADVTAYEPGSEMSEELQTDAVPSLQKDIGEPVQEIPVEEQGAQETKILSDTEKLLEKARASAQRIAQEPVTEEVEEEFKKARAYAAAQRISAFATAYNRTGQMPTGSSQKMPRPAMMQPKEQATQEKTQQEKIQQKKVQQEKGQQLTGKQLSTGMQPDEKLRADTEPMTEKTVRTERQFAEKMQEIAQPKPVDNTKTIDTDTGQAAPAGNGQKVIVTVNGEKVVLSGKPDYIYVDVFDHIDFDLSRPQGKTVETLINGRSAQYVEPLKTGDVLEIFWKE